MQVMLNAVTSGRCRRLPRQPFGMRKSDHFPIISYGGKKATYVRVNTRGKSFNPNILTSDRHASSKELITVCFFYCSY